MHLEKDFLKTNFVVNRLRVIKRTVKEETFDIGEERQTIRRFDENRSD